jgi:Protein of unknown function (DUF1214)
MSDKRGCDNFDQIPMTSHQVECDKTCEVDALKLRNCKVDTTKFLAADLQKAADGSLTIYLSKTSPSYDKVTNELPAPKGDFSLYVRKT